MRFVGTACAIILLGASSAFGQMSQLEREVQTLKAKVAHLEREVASLKAQLADRVEDPNAQRAQQRDLVEDMIAQGVLDEVRPAGTDSQGFATDPTALVGPKFYDLPFSKKQKIIAAVWEKSYADGADRKRQVAVHDRDDNLLGAYSPADGLHLK